MLIEPFVMVYHPVQILVVLPKREMKERVYQDFSAGSNQEIRFYLMDDSDELLPDHVHKIINGKKYIRKPFASFKRRSPSLADVIEEGLMKIGMVV